VIEEFIVRFTAWWRINVSGALRLGAFLRFVMHEDPPANTAP
jgi:hypothetical protein